MKIETQKKEFNPVTISFTCETQAELDALGGMFNSTIITDALMKVSKNNAFEGVYQDLKDLGAEITDSCEEINQFLKEN